MATTVLVLATGLAVPANGDAAALHRAPGTVHAGDVVRVFGSVAGGCEPGATVTLISGAFRHTHDFAGQPAVFTPTAADGSFSVRTRIPRGRTPGVYTIGGRCGGGNLGISRRLRVLAPRVVAARVRISDHAAFLRAVVGFRGRLGRNDAEATDPEPADGTARIAVLHGGIRRAAPVIGRLGVRLRIAQGTGRLAVGVRAAPRRFKFLAYRQLHGPERLVIDLYKSRTPSPAAEIPSGWGGCLAIATQAGTPGTVVATGTAQGIFESQFTLAVRSASGRVVGTTHVAFGTTAPNWEGTVSYAVTRAQTGTLEAFDSSARDGALACLAQVRVPLAPP